MKSARCIMNLLVYGMSDTGKTTQGEHMSRWIRERMGQEKILRLASASGGGWGVLENYIDKGYIVPMNLLDRKFPYETLYMISRGAWPADPSDPESPLLPPSEQKDWANVGGLMIEGLTEAGGWMMKDTSLREASGTFRVSQENPAHKFKDGETAFSTPGKAVYGTVQNHLSLCVTATKSIPNRYVLWTALEMRATDDNTRLPLYGPELVGKAKTAEASAWFDNTLHMQRVQKVGKRASYRMYLTQHFGDDGIPCVAKNRAHWSEPLPEFLEDDKANVYEFLSILEESHLKAKAKFK